jgi:hypothetical protein
MVYPPSSRTDPRASMQHEIEIAYTYADVREAITPKGKALVAYLVFIGVLLAVSVVMMSNPGELSTGEAILFYGAMAMPLVFGLGFFPLMAWLQYRANRQLRGRVHLRYDDHGFEFETPTTTARTKWEGVERWWETRSVFLIQPGHRLRYAIPKRSFTTADHANEFRELLRTRTPRNPG